MIPNDPRPGDLLDETKDVCLRLLTDYLFDLIFLEVGRYECHGGQTAVAFLLRREQQGSLRKGSKAW